MMHECPKHYGIYIIFKYINVEREHFFASFICSHGELDPSGERFLSEISEYG